MKALWYDSNLVKSVGHQFEKNPFLDAINTDFFYRTRQHEEAAVKIRCGIEDGHALILLAGQSGTGKTLVSQVVLRSLVPSAFYPIFVGVHPGMGKGGLLRAILTELGVKHVPRFLSQQLALIHDKTLDLYEKGKRLIIVIDEAHFLKSDALHILRTLSNLENENEKLVTVLLIAEESFRRRLNNSSYASLRGRITFTVLLHHLDAEEVEQLIKYRLLKCQVPVNFIEQNVYAMVCKQSKGIVREIMKMLYNGWLEALSSNERVVSMAVMQRSLAKVKGG